MKSSVLVNGSLDAAYIDATYVSDKSSEADTVSQIYNWFSKAVPEPEPQNIQTQIAVHFEEVAEMLSVISDAGTEMRNREEAEFVKNVMEFFQKRLKNDTTGTYIKLDEINRTELLDALCDQIVTAIGVANFLGMDILGALKEVADSNDSKFDENGDPIFNEARKIVKGPNYFKPSLSKFV